MFEKVISFLENERLKVEKQFTKEFDAAGRMSKTIYPNREYIKEISAAIRILRNGAKKKKDT